MSIHILIILHVSRDESRAATTSKMERFVIIVNGSKPLTIIRKRSILDVAAALVPLLLLVDTWRRFNVSTGPCTFRKRKKVQKKDYGFQFSVLCSLKNVKNLRKDNIVFILALKDAPAIFKGKWQKGNNNFKIKQNTCFSFFWLEKIQWAGKIFQYLLRAGEPRCLLAHLRLLRGQ